MPSAGRGLALVGALLGVGLANPACADRLSVPGRADEVKQRHEEELMRIPGVVGVGVGQCDEQACIKVFLERQTPELAGIIPDELEGVQVELEEIGRVSAQ